MPTSTIKTPPESSDSPTQSPHQALFSCVLRLAVLCLLSPPRSSVVSSLTFTSFASLRALRAFAFQTSSPFGTRTKDQGRGAAARPIPSFPHPSAPSCSKPLFPAKILAKTSITDIIAFFPMDLSQHNLERALQLLGNLLAARRTDAFWLVVCGGSALLAEEIITLLGHAHLIPTFQG